MTICLCMCVKNEEKILARALRSAKPLISTYLICDTGSTDRTKEIIREELGDLPGEILDHDWISFGANKTKMLAAAKGKADYLLMLDADHEVQVLNKDPLPDADQLMIRFAGPLSYRLPQLIRGHIDWSYAGPTHEVLQGPYSTRANYDGFALLDHGDGSNRHDKLQRDINLLTAALKDDPLNPRYLYYLAQSYRDLGDHHQAFTYYSQRAQIEEGFDEERWHAQYQAARLLEKISVGFVDFLEAHLQAFSARPTRLEPLYHLVKKCRETGMQNLGFQLGKMRPSRMTDDVLFVELDAYQYAFDFEYGLCAWYAGHPGVFKHLMEETRDNPLAPPLYHHAAIANLRWVK